MHRKAEFLIMTAQRANRESTSLLALACVQEPGERRKNADIDCFRDRVAGITQDCSNGRLYVSLNARSPPSPLLQHTHTQLDKRSSLEYLLPDDPPLHPVYTISRSNNDYQTTMMSGLFYLLLYRYSTIHSCEVILQPLILLPSMQASHKVA